MSVPIDLLEQARTLARHDPNKPKQANLHRAVSSAFKLRQLRHAADYDFSISIRKSEALDVCDKAEQAMKAWIDLKRNKSDALALFAMAILLWPGLSGR